MQQVTARVALIISALIATGVAASAADMMTCVKRCGMVFRPCFAPVFYLARPKPRLRSLPLSGNRQLWK